MQYLGWAKRVPSDPSNERCYFVCRCVLVGRSPTNAQLDVYVRVRVCLSVCRVSKKLSTKLWFTEIHCTIFVFCTRDLLPTFTWKLRMATRASYTCTQQRRLDKTHRDSWDHRQAYSRSEELRWGPSEPEITQARLQEVTATYLQG